MQGSKPAVSCRIGGNSPKFLSHPAHADLQPADVDVGIVYTGEDQLLMQLLDTLRESIGSRRQRVLLIDNASDRGVASFTSTVKPTTVIQNKRRLTYAENINRILAASKAPYILLLNTDIYFEPEANCLAEMLDFMHEHPDCGIAGCRVYHPDGNFAFPARRFPTVRTIACRRLGLSRFMPNEIDKHLYRNRDHRSVFDCDWLSGCFLMLRRAAFEDVGLFDCGFKKYFEDVDYCLRVAMAGWRVMFNGATHYYHYEQRSSRQVFSKSAFIHLSSYLRWLRKWGVNPQRLLAQNAALPSPSRESVPDEPEQTRAA